MFLKRNLFRLVYNDPPEGEEGKNTPPPGKDPPPPVDKKFTQDDVNKFLAEDRRKHKQQTEKIILELESLKESKSLTDKERETLQTRIEELNNQLLTKEQLAEKEKQKLENQFKKQLDEETKRREKAEKLFTESTINRTITDAAISEDAFSPEQLVSLLEKNARLVEQTNEDGTSTGNFVTMITFQDVNKEGQPVTLNLTVREAVKRMKELPDRYGNLFKSTLTAGLGGSAGAGGGRKTKDPSKMSDAEYLEWRKQNLKR